MVNYRCGMKLAPCPGMNANRHRLIVVSNRLPFVFQRESRGAWRVDAGSGGLVSALLPVLRHRGGTWIGWPGTSDACAGLDPILTRTSAQAGFALHAVHLTAEEVQDFYHGFSNEVIWPLFHDLQPLCNFDPKYWRGYCGVNRKFAQVIMRNSNQEDFVWVHDYHLMNIAQDLRRLGCGSRTGFFLHIPFPPPDLFLKLPWCRNLIEALLEYELVGFQTLRDRRNFVECVKAVLENSQIAGRGQIVTAVAGAKRVRIGVFPIGIDFNDFLRQTATPQVAAKAKELHTLLPDRRLVLGVDRLDYTKGIPHRLNAFENLLTRYPDLKEKISLIQVVVPSRVGIPDYNDLKTSIEQTVGRINGAFVRPGGWVPVWYVYGSLTRTELLAYYRAADIALVTPLKDGMNLVAKEYCACSMEEDCVLILSEFAGAAAQLHSGALLVNPYDIEGVADAIVHAYEMDAAERSGRMRRLRRSIRKYDVFWWVDSFLSAAFTKDLSDFPLSTDYVADSVEDYLAPD